MEPSEELLILKYAPSDIKLTDLVAAHSNLNKKVDTMQKRKRMTPSERSDLKAFKLQKLYLRERIIRRLKQLEEVV